VTTQEQSKKKLDNGSKNLLDLIDQYKSLENIPNDQLNVIGYVRDRMGVVIKKTALEKKKKKLEEKTKNSPFGLIEVDLEQKDIQGKRVSSETIQKIKKFLKKYEKTIDDID